MFYVKVLEAPLVLPYTYRDVGRELVHAECVITQGQQEYEHHVCQAHDVWVFWEKKKKEKEE